MEWTKEQRRVIETRGCGMLVSAAAGSGKTAVLVERILSMLTDAARPLDIDRLLVVTFTNAAAGEMKDRLRQAIEKRLEDLRPNGGSDAMQAHLSRQISLLANAQITTMHSFCQSVIRNHFHTIDLDPGLRVADEGEQRLIQQDVMDDLLESCYAAGDADFLRMAECVSPGTTDGAVAESVLALYRFSRSFPFPEQWFDFCIRQYQVGEDLDGIGWVQSMMQYASDILSDVRSDIQEAKKIAASPEGPYPYLEALNDDETFVDALLRADTFCARQGVFAAHAWEALSRKRGKDVSDEKKARVKALRDAYKDTVNGLMEDFFFETPAYFADQMRACAPIVETLVRLTARFADAYLLEKQKKGVMDFDDLEHYALQILVGKDGENPHRSAVAERYADHFEEILIDEYQDSNLVQEMLLTAVSRVSRGQHNVFMVGDVKQSIYRFRLARPELFMEKYHTFPTKAGGEDLRIDLHKNFRSRHQVLEAVNYLFAQIMERRLGNIDYDASAALHAGAEFAPVQQQEACVQLCVFSPEADDVPDEGQQEESSREKEARLVAGRIRAIVGNARVWDKDEHAYRPARYGDIVILLRTMHGWSDAFARVLNDLGVPAHTGSRTGYFSTLEVQTVLSLLRVIDNPRQDIPLAAVLHSPMAGVTSEELAAIKSRHKDVPFHEACRQEESLAPFFAMLGEFRAMAGYTPIHELLWHVLDRTGYGAYAAAMPGGEQRKANLDMLVEKAIAYESGSYHGLYNFVRYIDNLHKYDVDFGEAQVDAGENAVRVMSIHKSKGLEFPIVFVCGMGKQINQMDARGRLVLHADLGIGLDFVDLQARTRTETLLQKVIKRRTRQESLGEELRVLYVAATRAKEKLILVGTVPKFSDKLQKWADASASASEVLPFTWRLAATSYFDWVIPALLRNRCCAKWARQGGGEAARHLSEIPLDLQVDLFAQSDLVSTEKKRQADYQAKKELLRNLPTDVVFDETMAKKLEENRNFCYTYAQESSLPAKMTVSELKKMAEEAADTDADLLYEAQAPVPLIPAFLQTGKAMSGADLGTAYHRVMERMDFAALSETPQTSGQTVLEELARSGRITKEEQRSVSPAKIGAFLKTPLAGRMMAAAKRGQLEKERRFVLEVKAGEIRQQWGDAAPLLVQGILDAYFVEAGEIVLLDYKTDFVKASEAHVLAETYAAQLRYYQMALERLVGRKVKEKILYSFCLDREIRVADL